MLRVSDLHKQYEGKPLLCGASFDVAADETVCLLGPSGGGKSTILRIIAGLEDAEGGNVFWDGQAIDEIPAHLRGFGFMFQDYALFPHLNVFDNVAFGLKVQKLAEAKVRDRVAEVLTLVEMESFSGRSVIDLSGGEKQRIAFARAIATWPRMLILDEPMGALDRTLRDQLLADLQQLLDAADIPVIYVTHDQQEAFTIADRILILHDGRIIQSGTPQDVYSCPANLWTASFLGMENRLGGKVSALDPFFVDTMIGPLRVGCSAEEKKVDDPVELLLMDIRVDASGTSSVNTFPAEITAQRFVGQGYQTHVRIAHAWNAVITIDRAFPAGKSVQVTIKPQSIQCYIRDASHEDC